MWVSSLAPSWVSGGYVFADEGGEVGCDAFHLLAHEALELGLELEVRNDVLAEGTERDLVDFGEVVAHGVPRAVEDALGDFAVLDEFFELLEALFAEAVFVADEVAQARVGLVVGHKLDELGEVPAVPLFEAHDEGVEVLLHLVEHRERVDDRLVLSVHVELDQLARKRVAHAQAGLRQLDRVAFSHALEVGAEVRPNASVQLHHGLVERALDAHLRRNISCKVSVQDRQQLLLRWACVGLQKLPQEWRHLRLQQPRERLLRDFVARERAECLGERELRAG